MFASRNHPLHFAETRIESALTLPNFGRFDQLGDGDPLEQMEDADRADRRLLQLVACTALATLVMALAASL